MKVKLLKKLRDRFRIYKKGSDFYFLDLSFLDCDYEFIGTYKKAKEKQRKEILNYINKKRQYKRIL